MCQNRPNDTDLLTKNSDKYFFLCDNFFLLSRISSSKLKNFPKIKIYHKTKKLSSQIKFFFLGQSAPSTDGQKWQKTAKTRNMKFGNRLFFQKRAKMRWLQVIFWNCMKFSKIPWYGDYGPYYSDFGIFCKNRSFKEKGKIKKLYHL